MNPLIKLSLTALAIFLIIPPVKATVALNPGKCEPSAFRNEVFQVQKRWNETSRDCFISVSPTKFNNLTYRDYYFDNSGFFMVFNSFDGEDESVSAGSRSYFLFPQVAEYPEYYLDTNNDLIVKMISGHELRLSGKDFSVVSLSSAVIKEKPVSADNNGGIEIKLLKGFWFDAGFKFGGTRLENRNEKTAVRSAVSDQTCSLINRSFLNYDSAGEFSMKLTGLPFIEFLQKKCPQLKL